MQEKGMALVAPYTTFDYIISWRSSESNLKQKIVGRFFVNNVEPSENLIREKNVGRTYQNERSERDRPLEYLSI